MKVTLIGDSIRLNSQPFVRDYLPPAFQVWGPSVNCESSRKVASEIRGWISVATADIVHINCGLHDIRFDPDKAYPLSSPEEYVANLEIVFTYLASTVPTVIWATSTPINEAAHNSSKLSRRYQADLLEYNRLSVALALDFGFHVNDMYQRMSALNIDALLLADGVHFNQAGNALIGKQIADAILARGGAQ